jgi:tRNA (guanine10-N2)-dimethyltransferase
VFSVGNFYFGRINAKAERRIGKRMAGHRPFFHPSTLQPKLAGCMVNLARVRPTETLLDPFCTSSATLLEVTLLGNHPQGLDISSSMVEGAKQNLIHFGVDVFDLVVGDARRLPFHDIDAVATDPPY